MTDSYALARDALLQKPAVWLVTGAAGFIGSNLVETLLRMGQTVVGLDNFATGHRRNLTEVEADVGADLWRNFRFIEGDICDLATCQAATAGVHYVLHQAALGSVPRSMADPLATNAANVDGFLNMLVAARDAGVRRFVYAASSSTYGDSPSLPKVEDVIGAPLSPYAVTKYVNELYAGVFARSYGFRCVGLRYFNVFGRRQDPEGAYAAVIPLWTASLLEGRQVFINGDGETSRDFCHVDNAVQANILAALAADGDADEVYNVAVGERTSLNELFAQLVDALATTGNAVTASPAYRDFRQGDVRHSLASIEKAAGKLGYRPAVRAAEGIRASMPWYVAFCRGNGQKAPLI